MRRALWAKWFFLPVPLALLFVGAYVAAGADSDRVVAAGVLMGKLFTLMAFVLAAIRFSWGDRLHTAWSLLALNMTLLLGKDLCFGTTFQCPGLDLPLEAQATVRAVMSAVANTASTVAMILLARAFRDAGLDAAISKPLYRVVNFAVFPVAFAIFIVSMRENLQTFSGDTLHTFLMVIIPQVADLVCFSLIGPLALTALALRGGALSWPWALLALGNGMWLLWDLATAMTHLSGITVEVIRVLALGYTGAAGLEQWWLLRPVTRVPVLGVRG